MSELHVGRESNHASGFTFDTLVGALLDSDPMQVPLPTFDYSQISPVVVAGMPGVEPGSGYDYRTGLIPEGATLRARLRLAEISLANEEGEGWKLTFTSNIPRTQFTTSVTSSETARAMRRLGVRGFLAEFTTTSEEWPGVWPSSMRIDAIHGLEYQYDGAALGDRRGERLLVTGTVKDAISYKHKTDLICVQYNNADDAARVWVQASGGRMGMMDGNRVVRIRHGDVVQIAMRRADEKTLDLEDSRKLLALCNDPYEPFYKPAVPHVLIPTELG